MFARLSALDLACSFCSAGVVGSMRVTGMLGVGSIRVWRSTFLHSAILPCTSGGRRSRPTSCASGLDGVQAVQRRRRRCGPTLATLARPPSLCHLAGVAPRMPRSCAPRALPALFLPVPCVCTPVAPFLPVRSPSRNTGRSDTNKVLTPTTPRTKTLTKFSSTPMTVSGIDYRWERVPSTLAEMMGRLSPC